MSDHAMKRFDFDWGYVGIEQRENEYGEWVRYEDALAFYSKELDHAYAEGRKDEAAESAGLSVDAAWTVFNGGGAVVREDCTLDTVRDYMTPERFARGWSAVFCLVVTSQKQLDVLPKVGHSEWAASSTPE